MYNAYILLRILMYPFIRFVLPLISSKYRARLDFELKELLENSSVTSATYSFEISSEGELEQVYPIMEKLLNEKQVIEIVYCSPSVEHRCLKIQKIFSDQVRLLRLPILRFNPFGYKTNTSHWLTGKYLFLCRYDFFPELFRYGRKKDVKFILISGMSKTFNNKNLLVRIYLKYCYQSFDKIVCATHEDQRCFIDFVGIDHKKLAQFDFREVQIQRRQSVATKTIKEKLNSIDPYLNYLEQNKNSVILGSFWNHEFELFNYLDYKKKMVAIAPHLLSDKNISDLINLLNTKQIPAYVISELSSESQIHSMLAESSENPGVWIINLKGILCEFFTYFTTAYIGGGFGESIHSVLEPSMAGCMVYCGPNNHRSAEFRLVKERRAESIHRLDSFKQLGEALSKTEQMSYAQIDESDGQNFKNILEWINIEV